MAPKRCNVSATRLSHAATSRTSIVVESATPPAEEAARVLAEARDDALDLVHPAGTVIIRQPGGDARWWTWAGWHANATLVTTLSEITDPSQRIEDFYVRLRADLTPQAWKAALADAGSRMCLPAVDRKALDGLKFSDALPRHIAEATLAQRLADLEGARAALSERHRFVA